ncbi:MAG: nickel pincer cofactor biosynthesis protein LarC [Kiritimatiellia bacterium]
MTRLYLDCASGISGDMLLAALLDLGADETNVRNALASLQLPIELIRSEISKDGLRACDIDVRVPHEHHHRHLSDIITVLNQGALSEQVKTFAIKTFQIIAEAEAKVHGCNQEEVHFHEVGALDSIADIVGCAVCLENLGFTSAECSPLCEGTGTVTCAHGVLPVPAPATVEILSRYTLPIIRTTDSGEHITPTGAALAAMLSSPSTTSALPQTILRIGVGAGKRTFPSRPNILRAIISEVTVSTPSLWMLETNLDDATGEQLGYAMECILTAGARDVHTVPCTMKKGRPGVLLRILCDDSTRNACETALFFSTPTLGIRRFAVERTELDRTIEPIQTPWGEGQIKRCICQGHHFSHPEFESVKAIAEAHALPFQTVYNAFLKGTESCI